MKFLDETGLKFIATKFKELRDSLTNKVDKVTGKDLSSNDYTNEAKAKVDAIPPDPKYTDTVPDLSPYATKYGDLYDEYNERKAEIEELRRYHISDIQSVNTDINNVKTAHKTDVKRLESQKLNKADVVNDLTTGGVDKALSAEQGKTLYEIKLDKTDVKTKLSEMTDDATHRLVTDTEKTTWNGKVNNDQLFVKESYKEQKKKYGDEKLIPTVKSMLDGFNGLERTIKAWAPNYITARLKVYKQQVILTQSQYDALSSTDKSDASKIYFIKA